MSKRDSLWVVMPVYNEEASLERVVLEWLEALRNIHDLNFQFLAIDDGSEDQTLEILSRLARTETELQVVSQKNAGHGHSCIRGYEMAIAADADYIFQIDSDGQCDPRYFEDLWSHRSLERAVFGFRRSRDDGFFRLVASRFVSLVIWLATGTWVSDANVPYRLMPTHLLRSFLAQIPDNFALANIWVSLELQRRRPIYWTNIHFRDRYGGSPSVKPGSFINHGVQLFRQLRAWKNKQDPLHQSKN